MLTELIISGALIASGPVPHTGDLYFVMPTPVALHNEQGNVNAFPFPAGVEIGVSVSFTAGAVERIDFEVADSGGYIFYVWANSGTVPGLTHCTYAASPFAPRFFGPVDLWSLGNAAVVRIDHNEQGWDIECRVGAIAATPDFNADGSVDSQDFFDFLAAFFVSDPRTDYNRDLLLNSQDFFDFLNSYLGL